MWHLTIIARVEPQPKSSLDSKNEGCQPTGRPPQHNLLRVVTAQTRFSWQSQAHAGDTALQLTRESLRARGRFEAACPGRRTPPGRNLQQKSCHVSVFPGSLFCGKALVVVRSVLTVFRDCVSSMARCLESPAGAVPVTGLGDAFECGLLGSESLTDALQRRAGAGVEQHEVARLHVAVQDAVRVTLGHRAQHRPDVAGDLPPCLFDRHQSFRT